MNPIVPRTTTIIQETRNDSMPRQKRSHARSTQTRALVGVAATILVLMLVLASFSVAEQGEGGHASAAAGRVLDGSDWDVAMEYKLISSAVCYVDLTGSGSYSRDDSVVLTLHGGCGGTSQPNDIRLATLGTHPAGARLGPAQDSNKPLASPPIEAQFYYFDNDDTGRISPGDTIYVRMRNADRGFVESDDVRITPFDDFPAGSKVAPSDPDLSRGVSFLGTANEVVRHVDLHGTNIFSPRDFVYLTMDPARLIAGAGDVRIYSPEPDRPFGEILEHTSPETKSTVTRVDRIPCFVDMNDSGGYTAGNPVYLSLNTQCTATVQSGDIRLSSTPWGMAGSRVSGSDDEHGRDYEALPATRLGYIDQDGSGFLSAGDLVVMNIISAHENRVHHGDILFTPTGTRLPGALLDSDDPLVGTILQDLGLFRDAVVFEPWTGSTVPTRHDPVYLSPETTTGEGLRPGDVRLVPEGDRPYGGPVGFMTGEVLPALTRGNANVCSIDDFPTHEEQVYIRLDGGCPSAVQAGLVRLNTLENQQPFTIVRFGDPDHGATLVPLGNPDLKFFDATGNGEWSAGDVLYLDIHSPGENRVNVNDIRLTPFGSLPAGAAVRSADSDNNMPLTFFGGVGLLAGYVDVDRNNEFGARDHAYITPAPIHQYVSPLSARLTSLPVAFVAPGIPDDPGPIDPDPTPSPTPTPSPGPTPTPTPDPSGDEEEPTPGPALIFVLFALTGLAIWARARRC